MVDVLSGMRNTRPNSFWVAGQSKVVQQLDPKLWSLGSRTGHGKQPNHRWKTKANDMDGAVNHRKSLIYKYYTILSNINNRDFIKFNYWINPKGTCQIAAQLALIFEIRILTSLRSRGFEYLEVETFKKKQLGVELFNFLSNFHFFLRTKSAKQIHVHLEMSPWFRINYTSIQQWLSYLRAVMQEPIVLPGDAWLSRHFSP